MLKYILNVVIYLALALWIGSLVFFGAGVASLLFQPGMLPNHTMAGTINSAILARLGRIEIVAGVLLLGGTLYTAVRYRHWMNWFCLLLAVGMLGCAGYYTSVLFPRMDSIRVAIGDFDNVPVEKLALKAEFDAGHKLYSSLVKGVLGAGVLLLIFHTVAFVRYTELHASRYRELEEKMKGKRAEPRRRSESGRVSESQIEAVNIEAGEGIEKKEVAEKDHHVVN